MAIKSQAPYKQRIFTKKRTHTHYKCINLLITAHNLNEHYLTNETAVYIVFVRSKKPIAQLQIGNIERIFIDAIHTIFFIPQTHLHIHHFRDMDGE